MVVCMVDGALYLKSNAWISQHTTQERVIVATANDRREKKDEMPRRRDGSSASQVRPVAVAPKVCRESGEAADIAGAVSAVQCSAVEDQGTPDPSIAYLLESESDDGYTKVTSLP